jgi:hypothetical protein
MSYTPWDIQAGRNIANASKTGVLATLLTLGGCVGCLNSCLDKANSPPKIITTEQRIIHEYYDSNTNWLYNAHRVIVEQGTNRWIFADETNKNYFTEEFYRSCPGGDEIRFIKKK